MGRAAAGVRATLAVVLAVAGAVLIAPTPAAAAACTGRGVTVVVDFASLGGGVSVACAAGDPATGLAALQSGFEVKGTQRYGLQFVCRINGRPTMAQDACVNTPPANASWSYWHARPGGTWSYSSVGASAYNPAPGTVEGWSFGSGSPPSIAPPRAPVPPRPPAPKPTTTTAPGPRPSAATTTAPGPTPSGPTPAASSTSSLAGPSTPAVTSTVDAEPGVPADRSGSATGAVVGIVVVVLLAAGAVVAAVVRRRRSTGA